MTLGAIPEARAPREDELEREEKFTSGRVILIATDHGPNCRTAFTWALDQFVIHADKLILLHVLPKPSGGVSSCIGADDGRHDPQRDATHILFDKFAKDAKAKANVKVVTMFRHGDAGKEICAEAARSNPVAIIMGSRGLGLVNRVLVGSAAEYCVRNSPVPLVIVPHNYKTPAEREKPSEGVAHKYDTRSVNEEHRHLNRSHVG